MAKYFINVDFHNTEGVNKFGYGIIEADLSTECLPQIANRFVSSLCDEEGISIDSLTINVRAFSLVENQKTGQKNWRQALISRFVRRE